MSGTGFLEMGDKKEDEESFKICMDRAWFCLPGARYGRNCTSDPANGSVLYGDAVLLRQKFKETARLVRGNKSI